ncbi:MAG TPA: hypothetical protein VNJ71_13280 [Gemmatimonadales bacterium]|jgi:hypothetical protein|nr:hypothetical protein [Gemmatimonadales bacterium]
MRSSQLPLALGLALLPLAAHAQAAVDPSVAPRAVSLDRAGRRGEATELLGRYLATAPDDAAAWLELGRFYLLDSRAWHLNGHRGEPDGTLFLDFAATALDQALRRPTDSALVVRAMVEMDRVLAAVESEGLGALEERAGYPQASDLPRYVLELGQNLLSSCPAGGILVTGSDLESLAVWGAAVTQVALGRVLPLQPGRYDGDSLYRARVAPALDADAGLPVARALERAASTRPVCLSPLADSAAGPAGAYTVIRLARVFGPTAPIVPRGLSVVELVTAHHVNPNGLTREALDLYLAAAGRNRLLCSSLLHQLGVRGRQVCGAP